jgi:hypothetical protein
MMKRIMNIGLGLLASLIVVLVVTPAGAQTASQQEDQSSLGDYARKVHKDPAAAKPKVKVFDNDNLPKDDKLSVVGPQPPAEANAASPAAAEKSATAGESKSPESKAGASSQASPAEDDQAKKQAAWKDWQGKLTTQKDQIDLASRELDVLQREYQLRAAAMYADAGNRIRNSAQWDKQDADYKQKIADKQKAVEDAKQKLEDMQEEARKAGVPAAMREP